MKLNPADARRLASLSALAAGALVAGAGTAEAGPIVGTLNLPNGLVGFSNNYAFSVSGLSATHGAKVFSFHLVSGLSAKTGFSGSRNNVNFNGSGNAHFKATAAGLLALFSPGRKFSTAAGANNTMGVAAWRSWFKTSHSVLVPGTQQTFISSPAAKTTNGTGVHGFYTLTSGFSTPRTYSHSSRSGAPYTDQYALFQFTCPAGNCYGWLELSLINNADAFGMGNGFGPDMQLVEWGYDNTGAQDPAGDMGGVPEPGTLATTGLAALVLGAAGVRRWLAARSAKTA
jgi:hypothetical protein